MTAPPLPLRGRQSISTDNTTDSRLSSSSPSSLPRSHVDVYSASGVTEVVVMQRARQSGQRERIKKSIQRWATQKEKGRSDQQKKKFYRRTGGKPTQTETASAAQKGTVCSCPICSNVHRGNLLPSDFPQCTDGYSKELRVLMAQLSVLPTTSLFHTSKMHFLVYREKRRSPRASEAALSFP